MYLPECSKKIYSGFYDVPAMSVGWLGNSSDPLPKDGVCPQSFLDFLSGVPLVNTYRGSHRCEICGDAGSRGNGEYWVTTRDGQYYVLPAMVAHYVKEHGYCPPQHLLLNYDRALPLEEVSTYTRSPSVEEVAAMEAEHMQAGDPVGAAQDRLAAEFRAAEDLRVLGMLWP